MVVASAAKMVLLSGSLYDSWQQVVSPFWKWWLMPAAAPTFVHFGAISVDFIMWSLCFTKLIELSLGFLSGDHAFAYSFNEVRWPLCTGWTLGWCRMLPMPVSVQSYECCPVVVGWCLMLCHTQCNHNQTWNEQWHGTTSRVCLCPLPISSEWPLGWGWEPPCTVSSAHWCAS